jgi:glycosyltransferase involved in cell wall biosynthesis
MKIAILVDAFPPTGLGGTEMATYNIAKYLSIRGHEVHVVTTLDNSFPETKMQDGFYLHNIKTIDISVLSALSYSLRSIRLLSRIRPQIVHSQSIFRTGLASLLFYKLYKKPYIVYTRGDDVYSKWGPGEILTRKILKNSASNLTLTEDMKKEMKKLFKTTVKVIPNGISLDGFNAISKDKARSSLKIPDGVKVILFVGRFHPIKGLKYLVEAASIIKKQGHDFRLILVGDGEERKIIEDRAEMLGLKDNIMITGKVPFEKVQEYMVASDVFVLPSISEGFPNVILEAMAARLPIIATNIGGLSEIMQDGVNGYLVEPKNSGQIADKISYLIQNESVMLKMSENNKLRSREYSWDGVAKSLEDVYISVINNVG